MNELSRKKVQNAVTFTMSFIIMAFFLLALNSYNHSINVMGDQKSEIETLRDQLDKSNSKYDSLELSIWVKKLKKHDYVFTSFKRFNPNIDDCTVENFIKVVEYYNLDSTEKMFNICISQIIHESGAKHSRMVRRSGKLVEKTTESSGHAMGLTQIVPTTAFHFLRGVVTKQDKKSLYELGCTDFEFVYDYRHYDRVGDEGQHIINQHARSLVKDWLRDEKNNIALWGYITKYELERRNYNIDYFLLAYNRGGGFLNQWVRSGKHPRQYPYVRVINGMAKNMEEA